MADQEEVQSPCVSVCAMDDVTGLCMGCYRTAEEIENWWDLDNEAKQAVVTQAAAREASAFD